MPVCRVAACVVLQSGVFTRPAPPGVTAGSMPFLDWLLNVAAHATAGANGDADGPAAKRRRISEQSVTQGTASGGARRPVVRFSHGWATVCRCQQILQSDRMCQHHATWPCCGRHAASHCLHRHATLHTPQAHWPAVLRPVVLSPDTQTGCQPPVPAAKPGPVSSLADMPIKWHDWLNTAGTRQSSCACWHKLAGVL